jgi:hypothetical protein
LPPLVQFDCPEQCREFLGVNPGHVGLTRGLHDVGRANLRGRIPLAVAVGDGLAQYHADNLENSLGHVAGPPVFNSLGQLHQLHRLYVSNGTLPPKPDTLFIDR